MLVLPVGSGKGGVGKSLIAANLAIALVQAGKRVILADLDLGASNLHTFLGYRSIERGIGTFLNSRKVRFPDIVQETEHEGLLFVPGDAEIPEVANLKPYQKKSLLKHLLGLEADFLIMDLGAGSHANVIDFFLASGSGMVVITPALTSILNTYLFLKNAVFRIMHSAFLKKSPAHQVLEELRTGEGSLQRVYIPQILARVAREDPEGHRAFQERIAGFRPRFVLNMVEDPADDQKAQKLRRSCQEYLGFDLEHLGVIYRDDLQDIALGSRLPIILYKPGSVLSQAIYRLADKLMQAALETPERFEIDLDASYATAELEAESDFQFKIGYIEELLHAGALSVGDLVETIKTQQFDITQLKRENQLLKTKLARAVREGYEP